MLNVQITVEAILKFQEAGTSQIFFEMQQAAFTVPVPPATAADLFEDVAIEAIDEALFFSMKPANGKEADVVGVAVTRILSIG